MKTTLAGLLLGILLHANPAAQAADTIDTSAFSLGWSDGYYPDDFDMTLLSDGGGTIRIALHRVEPAIDATAVSTGFYSPGAGGDFGFTQLDTSVHAGYRIKSLALAATVSGTLAVTPPLSCPAAACSVFDGYAYNAGGFEWSLAQGDERVELPGTYVDNVQGSARLTGRADVSLQGRFSIDLNTIVLAHAQGTMQQIYGDEYYAERMYPAEAYLNLRDFVLTVEVAPVPEPASAAMWLAGLAVAAAAARRKRRAAP